MYIEGEISTMSKAAFKKKILLENSTFTFVELINKITFIYNIQ